MNNQFSLKILDLFQPVFRIFHIDYPMVRRILEMKLLMDGRRVPTVFDQSTKIKGNKFLQSLGLYAFYSLLLLFFLVGNVYIFQMSILFGISMFILMSAFISDFSAVLLDIRDKMIIGTKPIDARTIGVAKLLHVLMYITMLTGSFTIIPIFFMLFIQGIRFTILFIVLMALFVLFIVALTSLIYILVLHVFDGEKLKNMINYIQIVLSIGIVIGYQLVINVFNVVGTEVHYVFHWWNLLIPPMWFAAPFEIMLNGNTETGMLVLSSLSIIIPLLAIMLYYKFIPAFEQNLEKLLDKKGAASPKKYPFRTFWEKMLCTSEEEKYFAFAYQIMGKEREFKLKVYPTLGMAIVFPFIFLIIFLQDSSVEELKNGYPFIYMYFTNIFISITVHMLQFSAQYKGAWIFPMTGGESPKLMYRAAIKAFLVKLYAPVLIIVGIGYSLLFSFSIWLDVLIVFMSAILLAVMAYGITITRRYPFSDAFETVKEGGYTAKSFALMFLAAPFVLFHFLSTLLPYGKIAWFILLAGITVLVWKFVFRRRAASKANSKQVINN